MALSAEVFRCGAAPGRTAEGVGGTFGFNIGLHIFGKMNLISIVWVEDAHQML